jgi:hypothetical protein
VLISVIGVHVDVRGHVASSLSARFGRRGL